MNILWILLFSGLLSLSYCADNTTGNNNENGRDPRNDQEFPPHFIRVIKKTSKKECINLIVSGAYKFLNRKFKNNKLYFECNVPQCSAKAHAIVTDKNDKNPMFTRIDTVHKVQNGSGAVHLPDKGVRLAEQCRENIRQLMYDDPTLACKKVFSINYKILF